MGFLCGLQLYFDLLSCFSLFLLSSFCTSWRNDWFSAVSAYCGLWFADFLMAHKKWLLVACITLSVLFHRKHWFFFINVDGLHIKCLFLLCSLFEGDGKFQRFPGLSLGSVNNSLPWTDAFFILETKIS